MFFSAVASGNIANVVVKTSGMEHSNTNDDIFMKICNENSANCCETKLDQPNKNDFELGATDTFLPSHLNACKNFKVTGSAPSVTMRLEGGDGWRGEYVKVSLLDGTLFTCPIFELIDDNGSTVTLCSTDPSMS